MSRPWDHPPFPERGDRRPEHTCEGVGHVLSQWEILESEMSMLHAAFLHHVDHFDGIEAYGIRRRIFRERMIGLREEANRAFIRNPNQELEGEFSEIVTTAGLYSDRRNEIAHCAVIQIDSITFLRTPWRAHGMVK